MARQMTKVEHEQGWCYTGCACPNEHGYIFKSDVIRKLREAGKNDSEFCMQAGGPAVRVSILESLRPVL